MKKSIICSLFLSCSVFSFAQNKEEEQVERGFKKENVFVGSGINLGFFNGFILGLNPEIGYSLNRFVDVGMATNFSYITQNDQFASASFRQLVLGVGPFVRVWPVNMIFLGGQFEYNNISYSEKNNGAIVYKENRTAPSLLVGGGYGNRLIGRSQFYTSIMVDVLKDVNSPYIDQFNRFLPVFRTTFTFYLRPKNQQR